MKHTLYNIIAASSAMLLMACTGSVNTVSQKDGELTWADHERFFLEDIKERQSEILNNFSLTKFPDFKIDVSPLDDANRDCLPFIQKAVDDCARNGGGVVNIKKGDYLLCGTLRLKSNVCLNVNDGAYLSFSGDPNDFLPVVFSRWEGTEMYGYSPMIYAYKCNNVAIVGRGTIDAQGGKVFARWADEHSDAEDEDARRLHKMAEDHVPVSQRIFGEGSYLRPPMIQMASCSRILIEGIHLRESPFWVIHPVYCDNVIVRDVDIASFYRNNDGCVPESSSNVLIERCTFKVGDDAVAIKAGRNDEGRRIARPAENIIVRNCLFRSEQNGLTVGSEVSGGIQNIFMDSIRIEKVVHALYFKSNSDRGGYIKDVFVNNVSVQKIKGSLINFEMDYFDYLGGDNLTRYENFHIHDIVAGSSDAYGIFMDGKELLPIKNVMITKLRLNEARRKYYVYHCAGVQFYDCVINGDTLPLTPIQSDDRRRIE